VVAAALFLGACSGEDTHDVEVFFASLKPRAGYAEAVAPGHDTLYVSSHPLVTREDFFDVQPVFEKGEARLEIILSPSASDRVAAAAREHAGDLVALAIDSEIVIVSPVTPEFDEMLVLRGGLGIKALFDIAVRLGHG
jgi:hypothetical protein